jgi:hypothetical protein
VIKLRFILNVVEAVGLIVRAFKGDRQAKIATTLFNSEFIRSFLNMVSIVDDGIHT